ncbi:MAG: hypothetical protein OEM91_14015 [Hyphomicrobiales bacterium]|nr:hypothetical protein [Hyphomicrobiales bacterium]
MLKKTLMTAAAALAITTGASAINAPDANAGVKVHIGIGGHGWHGYGHYPYYGGYGYGCFTKWKKKKIKVWHNGHFHWKWVSKPYKVCY